MHRFRLIVIFVIYLSLAPQVSALPEWQTFSEPGKAFELKCAVQDGSTVWLGGSVGKIVGPWDQPVFSDGFLTKLGPDGQVLWEKEFGTQEGGDSVDLLAVGDSKVYLAGFAACDLESAWAGQAKLDWGKEFFLARLDQQGALERVVRLSASGSSTLAIEPYFQGESLTISPLGEVYLGARMRGRFGEIDALEDEFGRAVLLHFDSDLHLLESVALEGDSLSCLRFQGNSLLGAGTKDATPGSEMGPPRRRPVLWDLTRAAEPKLLWQGPLAENARCLQLESSLLFSTNDTDGALELGLEPLRLPAPLPPGVTVVRQSDVSSRVSRLAGGYRAQEWLEAPSTVCWSLVEGIWKQSFVDELIEWNRLHFLFQDQGFLTMVGTLEGPIPGEKRWCCWRLAWPK